MTGKRNQNAKQRTVDRVYEDVRADIIRGQHPPGTRLTEEMLGDRYQVSRTPVRAALHKLAADGFVDMVPRIGALVKTRSQAEIAEIYTVRALLEGTAAGLAASRRSEADLAALRRIADEMERIVADRRQIEPLSRLNQEFHQVIAAASGNKTLEEAALRLMGIGLLVHTYGSFRSPDIARSLAEHRVLIDALSAQDGEWATAVMRSHMLATRTALLTVMDPDAAAGHPLQDS
ncbi:putative transcriptional regulator, GntR family [Aurantimonas manganoxydans SI85-9A1]|uniref:Putative transcriptional regulator, GntR family n=1 Tax=Aurantimonas manganoxydans (strain ATCC BAA-1229 / DSM 21871 / SI85-9A1) TaxID=287752 RepID=Q1YLH4_AURMS|nr:GntR family transcriptional regulator [Aurantimonas manganoxydans]EAS51757.1 putative transcriptional regulator, GntR family [Aurantimonas manganoxydans SI85-9A1]